MEVTLLGTGDTTGTPTVGCECDTCAEARTRAVERTRFSVHVRNERTDQSLLLDASPDFRYQFLRDETALPDAILITHIHFDHIDGLGNSYRLLDQVPVHAADEVDPETGESVAETVGRKFDYLSAIEAVPQTPLEPFEVCGLEVTFVPVDHPPLLCYGVRIEDPATGASLSISGDTSFGVPERSKAVLANADLLLADGIVPASLCQHHPRGGRHEAEDGTAHTFGTKHMTVEGARRLAAQLEVDRHRVVHLSHFIPAADAFAPDMAVDGERFHL